MTAKPSPENDRKAGQHIMKSPPIVSPQEFAGFIADETAKWGGIIRTTGIKVE